MHKSAVSEYKHDGYVCEGFAVWDDAGAKRPGILVFPERVGVGEYTHKRAQMLGDLGFNAFVVDVYGKGIRPNTPETCQAEMMKYATNRPLLRERARCGVDQLRKVPNTDLSKMGAIGYCFGGLAVLEMARDGQNDLAGVVSFNGVLATATPLKPDTYKGKILVLHGDDGILEREARCQGKLGVRRLRQRAPHLHQLADARGRATAGHL
jgi:dienelactone hydrolase